MDVISTPLTLEDILNSPGEKITFKIDVIPEITNGYCMGIGEVTVNGDEVTVQDIAFNRTFTFTKDASGRIYNNGSPCSKMELDDEAKQWLKEYDISLD